MDKTTIKLVGPEQRQRAQTLILRAPDGYVVTVSEATRTLDQNAKLWPMLKDCQDQIPGMETLDTDDIKLRFLDALGEEMRYLPKLDGRGFFPVGHKSSALSKSLFAALIELIYAEGARHNVRWSEPIERAA